MNANPFFRRCLAPSNNRSNATAADGGSCGSTSRCGFVMSRDAPSDSAAGPRGTRGGAGARRSTRDHADSIYSCVESGTDEPRSGFEIGRQTLKLVPLRRLVVGISVWRHPALLMSLERHINYPHCYLLRYVRPRTLLLACVKVGLQSELLLQLTIHHYELRIRLGQLVQLTPLLVDIVYQQGLLTQEILGFLISRLLLLRCHLTPQQQRFADASALLPDLIGVDQLLAPVGHLLGLHQHASLVLQQTLIDGGQLAAPRGQLLHASVFGLVGLLLFVLQNLNRREQLGYAMVWYHPRGGRDIIGSC
jgi:hypothetical protein